MKLTKTPPQKRTIELYPNKNKMLAYFPELIFIQSANKLYVFYEYENTLNTITHIVAGYHGEVCFHNTKPSIDNFWNTEFIYNGHIETLKKKDWWKHTEYKSNLTDTAIAVIRNKDADFFNFIIKQPNIDDYDRIIAEFIKERDLTKKDFLIEKETEFYKTMATLLNLGVTDDLFYFYKNKTKDFHINKLLDEYLPIGTKEIKFITELDEINFAYYITQCIKKCYHNQAMTLINLSEKNSINDLNEDLLLSAHHHKTTFLVDFLIKKGANNLNEAMLVATKAGRKPIIERLLECGANNIDECLKVSPLEHISEVLKKGKS